MSYTFIVLERLFTDILEIDLRLEPVRVYKSSGNDDRLEEAHLRRRDGVNSCAYDEARELHVAKRHDEENHLSTPASPYVTELNIKGLAGFEEQQR